MAAGQSMDPHFVVYHCPCGSRIELPATASGRKARCRKCNKVFVVPLTAALTFEPPEVIIEVEPDEPSISPTHHSGGSFWGDLAGSLGVFLQGGNLATLLMITLVNFLISAPIPGGLVLWILQLLATAWLCAFLLETVLEVASGEDSLPTVGLTSPLDDLILPAIRFAATWLAAMAPAIVLACLKLWRGWPLPESASMAAYALGVVLWPAIVLTTAIGRSLGGLYPHIILRVPLAGPFAYLAVCASVAAGLGILWLPDWLASKAPTATGSWNTAWTLVLPCSILSGLVDVVSMRAIGFYYRHYKHKLPFEAE